MLILLLLLNRAESTQNETKMHQKSAMHHFGYKLCDKKFLYSKGYMLSYWKYLVTNKHAFSSLFHELFDFKF
jgi:hypothetical protein